MNDVTKEQCGSCFQEMSSSKYPCYNISKSTESIVFRQPSEHCYECEWIHGVIEMINNSRCENTIISIWADIFSTILRLAIFYIGM